MLLVSQDGISEVTEGVTRKLCEHGVKALANRFQSTPIDIVLDDPAYVSARYAVEFRRRRERRILAESRFAALAGEDGVGNWCIAPEGADFRLYVLALDPGSTELSCLKKLVAEGLTISRISSSLMSGLIDCSSENLVLRVVVRSSCVQLALWRHGVWVFARRIEISSGNAKEAIETTLRYLQSQGYLELPYGGVWELVANDQVLAGLTELWIETDAMVPEPHRLNSVGLGASRQPLNSSFNCIGWQQHKPVEGRAKFVLLAAVFVTSLMLAYVLPQQLMTSIEWTTIEGSSGVDVPEAVHQQFWISSQIQQWLVTSPQVVADDLTHLLTVLHEQDGVTVQELIVDTGRSYRVSCSLGSQYDDPLLKRELHLLVRDRVAARLLEHRISVREFDGHSLDSRQEESLFELVLELTRESE